MVASYLKVIDLNAPKNYIIIFLNDHYLLKLILI